MDAFAPLVSAVGDAKSADEAASAFEVIRLSVENGMPPLPLGRVNDLRSLIVKAAVSLQSREDGCWKPPALEAFERLRDALVARNATDRAAMERSGAAAHGGAGAAGAAPARAASRSSVDTDSSGPILFGEPHEPRSHDYTDDEDTDDGEDALDVPLGLWGDEPEEGAGADRPRPPPTHGAARSSLMDSDHPCSCGCPGYYGGSSATSCQLCSHGAAEHGIDTGSRRREPRRGSRGERLRVERYTSRGEPVHLE